MADPTVAATGDPALVLSRAHEFLIGDPVQHNLILTLLTTRVAVPQPGRYWIVNDGDGPAGVVFQSPLDFPATITPMQPHLVAAAVESIAGAGIELPGVIGEAASAARFAGHWTEVTKSPARPLQGQRIYEVDEVLRARPATGELQRTSEGDRETMVAWYHAFEAEAGLGTAAREGVVEHRIASGEIWIWHDITPVAMAGVSDPIEGVARIGPVYTPPLLRNRGYASALVSAVSASVRDRGDRCILYTDLANPTSNSIYRAIGYRAVAEVLRYRFG